MSISITSACDELGDIDWILEEAARDIAIDRRLGVTSDRDLYCVAMEGDKVVGAAWTAFDGRNFEFDIAVAKGFDRKGIGRLLTQSAISQRSEFIEAYDNVTMYIPVTSFAMCKLLQKEGFVVAGAPAKGFFIMGPESECEPLAQPNSDAYISNHLSP